MTTIREFLTAYADRHLNKVKDREKFTFNAKGRSSTMRCFNDMRIAPKNIDRHPMCVTVRWDGKMYLDSVEDRLDGLSELEQISLNQLEKGIWSFLDANKKSWYLVKISPPGSNKIYFDIARKKYFPSLKLWD